MELYWENGAKKPAHRAAKLAPTRKQKLFRVISGHGEVIESGPSEAK